jgi:hypothetical protein
MLRRVAWEKFTEVSVVLAASIIRAIITFIVLLMEAGSISETSVNFNNTARRNIPHNN